VAGAIGENFRRNAEELRGGWNKAIGEADEKSDATRRTLERTRKAIQDFGIDAGAAGAGLSDLGDGAADAGVELGKLENIKLPTFEYADELSNLATDAETAGQALSKLPADVQKTNLAVIEAGKSTDEYAASLGGVSTEYKQIGDGTVKATGAFAEVKDKTKDAAKALDELIASGKLTTKEFIEVTKNANDFKVKMEEIASNERIKTIEATVTLNVAALQADAERVQATFASIDTTISSTGDLLGSLFGAFTQADNMFDKAFIRSQIDLENKRRQEALDLQKKLAEAEIRRIEAQTRQLDRGDPWIRIDGTGLAPELEAFMWAILKATRTQVSAEFGNFLMGID